MLSHFAQTWNIWPLPILVPDLEQSAIGFFRILPKSMLGLARNWLVWRRDHYGHSHFILLKQKRIWKNRFSRVKNFSRSVMPNSCFWLFKVVPVYKTSPALSVYSQIFITGTYTGSESSNFHLNYSWAWDLIQIFCSVSKMDKIN